MKRMRILLSKRRFQVLATLAGVLVALSVVVGSGASFTATSANPSNVFSAGTLTMSNTPTGMSATINDMVPGDYHTGTVVIKNTGSVQGHFYLEPVTIAPVAPGSPDFAGELQLLVTEGASTIYTGPLSGLGQKDLGVWGAGDAHTYNFKVSFPDTGVGAENAFMGASTTADFNWTAVSVPGGAR